MKERSHDHEERGIPLNHDDCDSEECPPPDLDEAQEEKCSAVHTTDLF